MNGKQIAVTVRHNDGSENSLDGLDCVLMLAGIGKDVKIILTGIYSERDLLRMFISLFGNTEIGERMRRAASIAMEYLIQNKEMGFRQITNRNDEEIIYPDKSVQ